MATRTIQAQQNGNCVKLTQVMTPEGEWLTRRVEPCGAASVGPLGEPSPISYREPARQPVFAPRQQPKAKFTGTKLTIIPDKTPTLTVTDTEEECNTCNGEGMGMQMTMSVVAVVVVVVAITWIINKL